MVVLAAACGGSDDKKTNSSPSTDSSSSSSTSTMTPGGSSSSSGSSTPGSSNNNSGAVKTAALSSLESYRYTLKMEGSGTGGPLADLRDGLSSVPGASTPKANEAVTFNVDGAYVK